MTRILKSWLFGGGPVTADVTRSKMHTRMSKQIERHCPHCDATLSPGTVRAISGIYRPKQRTCDECGYRVMWLRWPQVVLAIGLPISLLTYLQAFLGPPTYADARFATRMLSALRIVGPLLFSLCCMWVYIRNARLIALPNRSGHPDTG